MHLIAVLFYTIIQWVCKREKLEKGKKAMKVWYWLIVMLTSHLRSACCLFFWLVTLAHCPIGFHNDDNGSRNCMRFSCVKFYLQCHSCFTTGIKFLVLDAAYLWEIFDLLCPLCFKTVQIYCMSKIKINQ